MEYLFLVYPAIGTFLTLYVLCRDSEYLFSPGKTGFNFFMFFFGISAWPIMVYFAIVDSIKYQADVRKGN